MLGGDLLAKARQSWRLVVIAVFVGASALFMAVYQRGSAKMTTADHMRQIKQRLEIEDGEVGGFPASLEDLGRRHGPLPPYVLTDGWEREIHYSASRSMGVSQDTGMPVFGACELRSAGPNGDLGDADDMVWNGVTISR